jgi:hypothetical protein
MTCWLVRIVIIIDEAKLYMAKRAVRSGTGMGTVRHDTTGPTL